MALSFEHLHRNLFCLISLSSLLILSLFHPIAANPAAKSYIVYMGKSTKEQGDIEAAKLSHLTLLSSVIPSEESERLFLKHIYHHSFKGFSAMLTEEEASILSESNEILSIFPDQKLELHTTRSWDFLAESTSGMARIQRLYPNGSSEVIIGVIDTDFGFGFGFGFGFSEIPSRWKGTCMQGNDFNKSDCNSAGYYDLNSSSKDTSKSNSTGSPRDQQGHGTHVASTAVGNLIPNADLQGRLARGLAKGGFPSSRIASYKVCSTGTDCAGSVILKAFDDAIEDGVHIISVSIGAVSHAKFLEDPIALGSLHAVQAGIMVIAAAGNAGPNPYTVLNTAPWIMTIAASTIDRDFGSSIVLGNKKVIQGFSINLSTVNRSESFPLVFGRDVAINSSSVAAASNCATGSLDENKVDGKIILCIEDKDFANVTRLEKVVTAITAQAQGIILVDKATYRSFPLDSGEFSFSQVDNIAAAQILKYINSTKNPTAIILPSVDIRKFTPAPTIPDFSARGPGNLTEGILKPDLTAPGVNILASVQPSDGNGGFSMGNSTQLAIQTGTSMACPHVSGAVAHMISLRPKWTPSMLRSALMTTAIITNNAGKPITNESEAFASPHEMGAGEVSPSRALHPGLVYETSTTDYLNFLCYFGYNTTVLRSMVDLKFTCPANSSEDLISDINYPSISIAKLRGARTITRTVTNVGRRNSNYTVKIESPGDLVVRVSPETLVFSPEHRKASFDVS
ncbi:hypothetical protein MKW98_031534 [Papaver atlanticum]|uniref:Uncharacterized protein n=1 Tax=Papaver atlanticum TaxID=357466 RepID=A0AAD4S7D1_9MAGN|nr:hypothetical protein MKW98_031534 [Papaver atlanticum]